MKRSKKLNNIVYFIFPSTIVLKKLLFHFLHFKLMIALSVTCGIIVICSNKNVKQVFLINHSLIFPTLQRGWGLDFCLLSKKWGRVHFSPKTGEVGKKGRTLLTENNLFLLVIFVFINPRSITIQGECKSNKF